MEFVIWAALGAAIGYAASQRRGFSAVGGVVGGALLGPLLAWLMFLVSGVTRADERKKCPHCAEWIQPAAVVCKHCQREIAPTPEQPIVPRKRSVGERIAIGVGLFFIVLVGVPLIALVIYGAATHGFASPTTQQSASSTSSGLTYANYERLREGMSYRDVTQILGSNGKEISRSEVAGISTVMYMWEGRFGANMNAMFQNGELISKAQLGLK